MSRISRVAFLEYYLETHAPNTGAQAELTREAIATVSCVEMEIAGRRVDWNLCPPWVGTMQAIWGYLEASRWAKPEVILSLQQQGFVLNYASKVVAPRVLAWADHFKGTL